MTQDLSVEMEKRQQGIPSLEEIVYHVASLFSDQLSCKVSVCCLRVIPTIFVLPFNQILFCSYDMLATIPFCPIDSLFPHLLIFCNSHLHYPDLSYQCPSILIPIFIFSFYHPLLCSMLSLSISPHSIP